ncbi:MAG: response regulator [Rhizobiales bacterium]|nr:response regulator [Hyphomicrobiales bacterium]
MGAADIAGSGVYIIENLAGSALMGSLLDHVDVGVCVVDGDLNIVAINRQACEILEFPADLIQPGLTLETLIRFNAVRGDFGEGDVEEMVRERLEAAGSVRAESFKYTGVGGDIIAVKRSLLPDGGFITTYANDVSGNASEPGEILKQIKPQTDMVPSGGALTKAEPMSQPPRARPSAPPIPTGKSAGMIDLVIAEDREEIQRILSDVLEEAGYKFRIARNGAEALSLYRSLVPRAMVMNVELPRISGLEVTGAIRSGEADTGEHLPIIGVAAGTNTIDCRACITAGMDHFLVLPLQPDLLAITIARCLEAKPPVAETIADDVNDAADKIDDAASIDGKNQQDQGSRARVLLAEDNQVNHEVFVEILEDGLYDVTGVWDGREAVLQYIANSAAYDVIMMDMAMPVMSGIAAIEAIRAHERIKGLAAIPIIGVSADTTEELRQQAERAGVSDYLIKPVNVDELLGCLARCKIDRNIVDLREKAKEMAAAKGADNPEAPLTIADLARKYQSA